MKIPLEKFVQVISDGTAHVSKTHISKTHILTDELFYHAICGTKSRVWEEIDPVKAGHMCVACLCMKSGKKNLNSALMGSGG
jgi:hypothetical protein